MTWTTPSYFLALVMLAVPLSGCIAATDDTVDANAIGAAGRVTHALGQAGAMVPETLTAPAFSLLGMIARAGPGYGGGEPSIWSHLDGTTYIAFPGCDRNVAYYTNPARDMTGEACEHGLIYRSDDELATFERLNQGGTGRLDDGGDGPAANGDAEVAVDAAGVVYTSNLGGGLPTWKSEDQGVTWTYLDDVVPEDHWADRQWMAAAAPGQMTIAWMGGNTGDADFPNRAVAVRTTLDAGETWTDIAYLGEDIGWLGQVAFAPDGRHAYIPYTQFLEGTPIDPFGLLGPASYGLFVGRSLDGGLTWEAIDTGHRVERSATGGHWSGVLMAPALDVTGDGTVVFAWAEDVVEASGATSNGAVVKAILGSEAGSTWSDALPISERHQTVMPWVTGGAGQRFAVTYLASDLEGDTDYTGVWDVMAASVDGATGQIERGILDVGVHQGGVCSTGGGCRLSGSDRALLDFFEADVMPDGRLVVVYPADPLDGGKYIEIRRAIQNDGSRLFDMAVEPPVTGTEDADPR